MYNNYLDKINNQIKDLENLKAQYMQPMIQQNFAFPTFQNDFNAKWIESIEQVKSTQVDRETIFMNKNEPIFYLKEPSGEIKTYKFEEYVELDEKDKKILDLENRLKELEMKENESVIQEPKSNND